MLIHPVIAELCATALAGVSLGSGDGPELSTAAVEGPELLRRFGAVSDGRSEQGRDHPVAVVLRLCAAAVLGGMRSFTAIAGWVADVPAEVLARLYARPARYPSTTTLWRVLTGADAAAVDGKTVRGALDAKGAQTHLLAAATHTDSLVLAQVEVGAKTNEIPLFAPLLDQLADLGADLSEMVITADALCRRRHKASYEDVRVMSTCCPGPLLAAVSRSLRLA